jgi:Putative adhesin
LTKKLFAVCAVTGLLLSLAVAVLAHDEKSDTKPGEKVERSLAVDAEAIVTLCVASGTLTVRGWDKSEVRVRSIDATQIEFRRIDKVKEKPPSRVDVMVLNKSTGVNPKFDCQAIADVEMEVPAGATVQVQTRDGDIVIAGVAGAYAGSQNGDITIERATKLVEAGSVGGSIVLKDSSGRINLSSAGGGVEAINIRAATDEDTFEVGTVSGDIQMDRVGNPKVTVKTVNGTVTMSGPLAKSGYYGLTNMTGDIVLAMPHDASFQLNAKVSDKHDIVSDFNLKFLSEATPPPPPVKIKPKTPETKGKTPTPTPGPVIEPIVVQKPMPAPHVLRRVSAICGSGDATISVASFGGTVRLKKI